MHIYIGFGVVFPWLVEKDGNPTTDISYSGTSPIRKRPPPEDPPRILSIGLL